MKIVSKYFKRIILFFFILLFIFAGALFVIGYYYGDEAEQLIVKEINQNLDVEVSVKDIKFSLFNNFPFASLEFTDIQTKEKLSSNSSPLLKAGNLSLLFNIYDIISGDYKVEKIVLEDAFLNLVVYDNGIKNYTVFQNHMNEKQESVQINLNNVIFKNVEVSYINYPSDQEYLFNINQGKLQGIFTSSLYTLDISGNFYSKHIRSGKTVFLEERALKTHLIIDVNRETDIYLIKDGALDIAGLEFDITGSIQSSLKNKDLDITINAKRSEIKSFFEIIPEEYQNPLETYNLSGELTFNAFIKGDFSGNTLPMITFDFHLDNGRIKHPESGIIMENASFKGQFKNGKSKSKKSFSLKLQDFKARLATGEVFGELNLVNFENPSIDVSVTTTINLSKIVKLYKIDTLQSISGTMDLYLRFKNKLKGFRQFTISDLISSKTSGSMNISDVNIKLKNSPIKYKNLNGSFNFNNKDLLIKHFEGNIANGDFEMKGSFINLLAYTFLPDEKIKVKADFISSSLKLDDFLIYKKSSTDTIYRLRFSERISFDLNLDIKEFWFRKFYARNMKGRIQLKDRKLTVDNASLKSMQGTTEFSGIIDGTNPQKFWLNCEADIFDVNIQDLFYDLGEFGQKSITSENLRGNVNAKIHYKSYISTELKIERESVYTLGDLVITDGELLNYKPLNKLSKFVKNEELEHVRFSTIKNQILIKDEVVYIPEMDIESNTLNLKINGTHTFQNEIEYHIQILLSELISRKEQKEEEIEGIFNDDDGLGRTTLFLKMTGNANDADIKYDTREVRKKISSDLKKEKQEIKDAFKKEFQILDREKQEQTEEEEFFEAEDNNQIDFKIDWEEEEADTIKKQVPSKKKKKSPKKKTNDKKDFIILWDEEGDTIK